MYDLGMRLAEAIEDLDRAVDDVVSVEAAGFVTVNNSELGAAVVGLDRDANRAAAAHTAAVGEWARRGCWRSDGSRSPAAALARLTRCSREAAGRVVRRARRLATMPITAAAFVAGRLSAEQVDLLCAANAGGRQAHFAEAESGLVDHAGRLGVDDLRKVLGHWRAAADDARPATVTPARRPEKAGDAT